MKTKNLFLGMVAGLFLVACANENDPVVDNVQDNAADQQYVGVTFVMNGDVSSRALGGFTVGTEAEVQVDKATFFFFDANGNGCADPYTVDGSQLNNWTSGTGDSSVDKQSNIIVVIKNPIQTPKSIVAVLNSPESYNTVLSLNQLQSKSGTNYATSVAGKFVMTNSVYADENKKEVFATPIGEVYKTEAEAKEAASVTIPVERVLARVDFDANDIAGSEEKVVNPQNFSDTSTEEITVKVKGWNLYAANNTSYLFKRIDPIWTFEWEWNDVDNKRSYWATSAEGKLQYNPWPKSAPNHVYVQENTTDVPTGIVVSAELMIGDEVTSLVKYRSNYYTPENFLNKVADESTEIIQKYYKQVSVTDDGTTYETLSANDLELAFNTTEGDITIGESTDAIKDYEAVVSLKDGIESLYVKSGEEFVGADLEEAKAEIMSAWKVLYWKDGKSYFWTPIEHTGEAGIGQYGIVRNHLYLLTLNSITGLGIPVTDPEQVIIPEETPADEEAYISAQIEILKYKTVTQSVDLNN